MKLPPGLATVCRLPDKIGMDVIPKIKLCDGRHKRPILIYCYNVILRLSDKHRQTNVVMNIASWFSSYILPEAQGSCSL